MLPKQPPSRWNIMSLASFFSTQNRRWLRGSKEDQIVSTRNVIRICVYIIIYSMMYIWEYIYNVSIISLFLKSNIAYRLLIMSQHTMILFSLLMQISGGISAATTFLLAHSSLTPHCLTLVTLPHCFDLSFLDAHRLENNCLLITKKGDPTLQTKV